MFIRCQLLIESGGGWAFLVPAKSFLIRGFMELLSEVDGVGHECWECSLHQHNTKQKYSVHVL